MATIRWLGGANAVAAVYYLIPASVSVGNIFAVAINGKSVTYQTALGTVADVIAGLVTALSASGVPPEFGEVTFAAPATNTYLSAIAKTAGIPVTLSTSASIGTGTTTPTFVANTTLGVPVNAAFSAAHNAGSLVHSTTYYYRVTAITAAGLETTASTETSIATGTGADDYVVTVNWSQVPGAAGYRIYGRSTGAELYIAGVLGEATLTYADTGAITPAGALPGSNATAVVSAGPNDWSTAANWSGGVVPVTGDTATFQNGAWDTFYGLSQSAVTLAALQNDMSYTGKIGLPEKNPLGYVEYRPTYLAISATTCTIGQGSGTGSKQIKLNVGSVACTCNVYNTGTPAESGLETFLLKGTSAGNVLNVYKGQVGVAVLAGETANLTGGFQVGYLTSVEGDARVRCGSGVTLSSTTITKTGGTLEINSAVSVLTQEAGTTLWRSGAIATLTIHGGTVQMLGTGTLVSAACAVFRGGTLDASQDARAKTITPKMTLYAGSSYLDPNGIVTLTAGWTIPDGDLPDVTVKVGKARTTFTVT